MSTKRFQHVCDVLRGPFPKQARMKLSISYINDHCEVMDIMNWMTLLLSYQVITDPNDNCKLLMVPLFLTLDINLRVAIIELYQNFTDKIPTDTLKQWENVTKNHISSTHIYQHNIWNDSDQNDQDEDVIMTHDDKGKEEADVDEKEEDEEEKKEIQNEQETILDEVLFSKFICDEVMMTINRIYETEKSDLISYDEIWTEFKTKTSLSSIPFTNNLKITEILQKDSIFYEFYVDKFILQTLVNMEQEKRLQSQSLSSDLPSDLPCYGYKLLSMDRLRSFIFWLVLSNHSHNTMDDIFYVYLWILIPMIVVNPKSRELREIIYDLMDNNQLILQQQLWSYLVALSFVCDGIQQFMNLMVVSNHKMVDDEFLFGLIGLICNLNDYWNDIIYQLLSTMQLKIKTMSVGCYQLLLSKIEYNSTNTNYSDKYIRFITQLIKRNRNHSTMHKQRVIQIVDNIATNCSLRVNSLQKFVNRL